MCLLVHQTPQPSVPSGFDLEERGLCKHRVPCQPQTTRERPLNQRRRLRERPPNHDHPAFEFPTGSCLDRNYTILCRPQPQKGPVALQRGTIRLSDELKALIDKWRTTQPDRPPRSEAIRRLVLLGLAAPKRRSRGRSCQSASVNR